MPTTFELTWDCPECCDEEPPAGDPCDPSSTPPTASGFAVGDLVLIGTTPWLAEWHLQYTVPGTSCVVDVWLRCDGSEVLSATWAYNGPGGATTGSGTIVSVSPLLVEYDIVGFAACPSGTVVVTI